MAGSSAARAIRVAAGELAPYPLPIVAVHPGPCQRDVGLGLLARGQRQGQGLLCKLNDARRVMLTTGQPGQLQQGLGLSELVARFRGRLAARFPAAIVPRRIHHAQRRSSPTGRSARDGAPALLRAAPESSRALARVFHAQASPCRPGRCAAPPPPTVPPPDSGEWLRRGLVWAAAARRCSSRSLSVPWRSNCSRRKAANRSW